MNELSHFFKQLITISFQEKPILCMHEGHLLVGLTTIQIIGVVIATVALLAALLGFSYLVFRKCGLSPQSRTLMRKCDIDERYALVVEPPDETCDSEDEVYL